MTFQEYILEELLYYTNEKEEVELEDNSIEIIVELDYTTQD